ncbi:MAG: uroporphyrinogen decarboxylase [Burkholderia sp.]|nr:uroporphyrinogen decarboxylase [Burkholderia sp.]
MAHTLLNDTLLRALLCEPTDYTPIWLMRQAGRYLPEYNATRMRAGSFLQLAKNPDYATEVTLQPLHRYPLDAAILFSDILIVPDAMGLGLSFLAGEGPKFSHPVRTEEDVLRLSVPDIGDTLSYITTSVRNICRALTDNQGRQRVPLIGFSGSPWTLACYMVEGGSSDDFRIVKSMAYTRPDLMHRILSINAQAVIEYLNIQIEAGVQAIMIFDTWGGTLPHYAYLRFSFDYIRRVISSLKRENYGRRVPIIMFKKGDPLYILDEIVCSGIDAVSLDWTINLAMARAQISNRIALQGNLDPIILFSPPNVIRSEVRAILDSYGNHPGHVFNLGHGISKFTPPEHIAELVDEVHCYSRVIRRILTV